MPGGDLYLWEVQSVDIDPVIFISYSRKYTGPYFFSSSCICSWQFAATKLVLTTCFCFVAHSKVPVLPRRDTL